METTMTDKTTLDYLLAARAAIAAPENWCTGRFATGQGAFCARGAIQLAVFGDPLRGTLNHPVLEAVFFSLPAGYLTEYEKYITLDNMQAARVAAYNNTHTHAEVLALFDRAIARQRVLEDRTLAAPLPEPPRSVHEHMWAAVEEDCARRQSFQTI
jgi:hypothetical protein